MVYLAPEPMIPFRQMTRFAGPVAVALLAIAGRAPAQTPPPRRDGAHAERVRQFDYDASQPLDVRERSVEEREGLAIHDLSYASPNGGRVPAFLVLPEGAGPFPAVVFQHGGGADRRDFLSHALEMARRGAASLLPSAPFARPGPDTPARGGPGDRDINVQTVVDLRRGVDLLVSRPDIDPTRLAFVGHSFGATIGGILAGVERRIGSFVLSAGRPAPSEFVQTSKHPWADSLRSALSPEELQSYVDLVRDQDPIHFVRNAAPAALYFQYGLRDEIVPIEEGRRYHAAASEPKDFRWYEAGHNLNEEARDDRLGWVSKRLGL